MTRSLGSFVNGTGDEFFACAGFPGNQNRGVGRSDLGNSGQNSLQRPRCADNLFEHRCLVDFFSQGNVFVLKSLLCLFPILDVSISDVPARDASFSVSERVKSEKKPTILPVFSQQARFVFERLAAEEFSSTRTGQDTVMIIRVN